MRLHEEMRAFVKRNGRSALERDRFVDQLTSGRAFSGCECMRDILKDMAGAGYVRDLVRLSASGNAAGYVSRAGEIKKAMAKEQPWAQEYFDYAVDSVSFALGAAEQVNCPFGARVTINTSHPILLRLVLAAVPAVMWYGSYLE